MPLKQADIFQTMFEHATIGILVVNHHGIIQKVNAFAHRLFGYEEGELVNQKMEILVPDTISSKHVHHRKKYHQKPVDRVMGVGLDLYAKRKDGSTFPVEISLGHVVLGEEKLAIAYVNDITQQKTALLYNQDISKIVEDSLNEIFIFEADSLKFVQVNAGGRKNLGYTQEELKNLTPIDIKPDYDQPTFLKVLQPLIIGEKEKIIFNTIHERKNKTTYPVEVHLQYASLGGQAVFVAIIVDITERVAHEQKILEHTLELEEKVAERTADLQGSQLKLTEAQAIAKMGHWDLFPQENKFIISKGMYQVYGLEEGIPVTSKVTENLVHPDDLLEVKNKITQAIQNKKGISINHRIITSKGELKYVLSNIQKPFFDENGQLIRLYGVLKDITSLKESENQLNEALNKEKELGILKSRFVSMASHEFRTPLSSILSSAELLGMYLESGRHEKCGRNINRIKNGVRNLTGILNDFLSLEKLEAGKVEVQISEINLATYLEELTEEIKPILRPNQQLLLKTHQQTTIETDPYLLKNILLNLISNAIKYSPQGQDVTLEIIKEKEQLLFKIIDRGIGIPREDKQHMFTRFFRASNVENIKGTGLGLTIVKRYLNLMNGDIGFESEYGKGSTFYFNLKKSSAPTPDKCATKRLLFG